ncbi:glycosyltransferase [Luteimonas sp. MC1825]|uniref:glycosyltransferase n=1 Tax=Luteimonas sp. MC1825 TaxID=2761107 RepID=UPI00161B59BF|nr:glycosyltransferase [Luteimonas sp. MC1825]MBB6598351.1 glycosyltransferase [Luteimonas sp. MC1825]QOC88554.1 glycosyltransferase [Luteimonas sp. MC1825]
MLSIIIPAHDEAPVIGATLDAVAVATRALGARVDVIVVDDASTDATAAIARARGARVVQVDVRHIAAARNAGAAAARGDRMLFVDADTLVNRQAIEAAMQSLDAGAVGGGTAVRFMRPLPLYIRLLESASIVLFRMFGVTPGCFIFCTRAAFEAAGGFDERLFVAEDVAFGRALATQGRVAILRAAVTTSARKMHTYSMGEKVRFTLRFLASPKRVSRTRDALHFWYGPRRHAPAGQPPETKPDA